MLRLLFRSGDIYAALWSLVAYRLCGPMLSYQDEKRNATLCQLIEMFCVALYGANQYSILVLV